MDARSLSRCVLFSLAPLAAGTLAGAQSQPPSMPGFPAVGAPPVVTLLAPGSAPRAPLRFKIASDYKASMLITMDMGFTMGGGAMNMDMPTMKIQADVAVTGVSTDGDVTFDMTFVETSAEGAAGFDPSVVAMMQAAASQLKGLKGATTMSSRGIIKSSTLDASKVADPNLSQALSSLTNAVQSLSVPLPEEAIGPGARWEVRQAISANGAHTFQKVECEVVSVQAATVVLRLKVEQTAPAQDVNNPNLPAGASVRIDKLSATGAGTSTMRLDGLVPTSEAATAASTMMTMSFGGQSQQMSVDSRLKVTVAPVK
jgi:hypothetical protein